MRYIDWNIKCYCDINGIIGLLEKKVNQSDCIVALQEVIPVNAEKIWERFKNDFHILYSLDHRYPDDEYDTDNRRLGVMLLVSRDIDVMDWGVFDRNIFPERTLFAILHKNGKRLNVATFHSVTGVSFKMAKAVQFRTYAAIVRDFKPDILSLDANEPRLDHYDILKMEFFDQGDNGKGARLFFESIMKAGLKDAFVDCYDTKQFKAGEPLYVSHIINNKINRRYDFVFIKKEWNIKSAQYLYEESCKASSDHAMVIVDSV